jgi:tubulin polyglutamylase TTLL5
MQPVDTKIWNHRVPGFTQDTDDDEHDSEEEDFKEAAEERLEAVLRTLGPKWTDTPVVEFSPVPPHQRGQSTLALHPSSAKAFFGGKIEPPSFRLERVNAPIVSKTLSGNGMLQTASKEWTIQWSGPMRDSGYQNLNEFQRVNHFPGSTELTRKDKLWGHFNEMKQAFGAENFDFVPESYIIPDQVEQFLDCYERTNYTWIVKPNASSQGKGIFLLRDLEDLPLDECSVVSRYIDNPLLIQSLKFDLRIYVLVTSYTPLRAYVYREGLTRFASSPYSMDPTCMNDAYRHLTNYSVNKTAVNFVENQEEASDNYGHKWSLSALNRHLRAVGINVNLMWARIMDLIVKTLLSVEPSIAAKARSLQVQHNCFECYGFDVLVDDQLKAWLLEVNLSPSMKADSPLDWKIKSSLLADAFNLVGICSPDRNAMATSRLRARIQQVRQATINQTENNAMACARRKSLYEAPLGSAPPAAPATSPSKPVPIFRRPVDLDRLTDEQLRMLALALGEAKRSRNFIRLHPTKNSSQLYAPLWDYRGPRGLDFSQSFRIMQATSARLLAAAMFGPDPIGTAVGELRIARPRCPRRGSDDVDSQESREPHTPKKEMMSSLVSETTKASTADDESDVDMSDLDTDVKEDSEKRRAAFLPDQFEGMQVPRPGSNQRPGSNSRPNSEGLSGLLPPSVPRPLLLGLDNARAAARAAMQSVPRSELGLPHRPFHHRSKSTPVLPRIIPDVSQPPRLRPMSQWIQAEPLSFHGDAAVIPPTSVKLKRSQQQTLEALNGGLNVEIEL